MTIYELFTDDCATLLSYDPDLLAPDLNRGSELHSGSWQRRLADEPANPVTPWDTAPAPAERRSDRERYFAKPGEAEWGC